MPQIKDLVKNVVNDDIVSNLLKRGRPSLDEFEQHRMDEEAKLFRMFAAQPVWSRKALARTMALDAKFVTILLQDVCVRVPRGKNRHKWVLNPDYVFQEPA
jgi:hypothetical protein